LEKEKGKNKMLMIRLKEGNTEDVVWRTGRWDYIGIFSGYNTIQR